MKTFLQKTLPGFLLLVCFGCGNQDTEMLNAASVDEVQATQDFPAVVLVAMPGGLGMCTGTFISPRTVLTAAHCTLKSGFYSVYLGNRRYQTNQVQNLGPGVVDDPNDVSVLLFNRDILDPMQVIGLGTEPEKGDPIRIVGYGCNDIDTRLGAGVKRTGTNHIYEVSEYLELMTTPLSTVRALSAKGIIGPENQAGSCFGDSGGPMLQYQDAAWRLTGITHAGGRDGSMIRSLYINLNRTENLGFLQEIDRHYDLHLFDGCWMSSDIQACAPDFANFKLFDFLKPWVMSILSWIWPPY